MEARRIRRRYDHRFREVVRETGDIELAVRKGVPVRSNYCNALQVIDLPPHPLHH